MKKIKRNFKSEVKNNKKKNLVSSRTIIRKSKKIKKLKSKTGLTSDFDKLALASVFFQSYF